MKTGWLIFIITLWIACTIICSVGEMASPISESDAGVFYGLTHVDFSRYHIPIVDQVVGGLEFTWEFIQVLWTIFWFNYSFFTGNWLLVKYVFFLPVSIGLIITIIVAVVRGTPSS
jgi:hypothetical protein